GNVQARGARSQPSAAGLQLKGISEQIVSTVRLIVPLTDPEAPHLVLQGGTFKAEAFGRSAVTRDLPGRCLQCLEDDSPLGFMEGRGPTRNVVKMRDLKLSDWHFQFFAVRKYDCALDEVGQFPDVAFPGSVRQDLHR